MIALFVGAFLGVTAAAASPSSPGEKDALPTFLKILKEHHLGPWLASRSPCREWSAREFRAETLLVASRAVNDSDCFTEDPGDRFLFTWPGKRVFLVVGEHRVPLEAVDSIVPNIEDRRILSEERNNLEIMDWISSPGDEILNDQIQQIAKSIFGARSVSDPGAILKDPYLDEFHAKSILLMGGRLPRDRSTKFERQFEWRSDVWLADSGIQMIKGKGRLIRSLEERIKNRLGSVPSITWPVGKPGSGHVFLQMRLDTAGKADSVKMIRATPGLEFLRGPLLAWGRGLDVRQGSIDACWIRLKIAADANLVRTVPDSLWKPGSVELMESKMGSYQIRPLP
ncbi:MAG: hypothetical protein IPK50_23840 [Fibrobacterota bacterium]|nr:hypothetical protein [Fibrobacterota bacterium]QQS05266.1 MAG: hypothetical protein IPK50_23840 [Fibrobacterota bacterium]